MRFRVVKVSDLDAGLLARWKSLQSRDPALGSPFFAPEFTVAVGNARDDVEIALIEEGAAVVGILPFHCGLDRIGRAIGLHLSDFHGLIADPQLEIHVPDLLRACRLVAWDFDHLLAHQTAFSRYHRVTETSPFADVSNGFESYVAAKKTSGTQIFSQCGTKERRLSRDVGPLRFDVDSHARQDFETVLKWKSAQYNVSGVDDVLAADWIRRTLQNLAACRSAELTGCVSMLYAGDKPVAGHLGIASQGAWHYWFPAYDRDFAKYSTGLSLLVQMLKSAGAGRPSVIDFGKGDQRYKEQLKTGDRVIASGSVELAGPLRFRRTVRRLIAGVPGSRELRDFVKRQVHGRVASPHK